jgi:hypothetical protein
MGRKWGRTKEIFDNHMMDIERDFEGGAEIQEIATRYGVSPPTITNWLITAGYKHRRRGRYPIAMKEKAVELFNRGRTPVAIGHLFHVKIPYIRTWLGLEPEPTREVLGRQTPTMEDAPGMRHKVGRRWTDEQKQRVYGFLQAPEVFTVATIYTLTGASRDRQQKIWREFSDEAFPLPKPRREPVARPEVETAGAAYQRGKREGIEQAERAAGVIEETFQPDLIAEFERGRIAGLEEAGSFAIEATPTQEAIESALDDRQRVLSGPRSPPEDES